MNLRCICRPLEVRPWGRRSVRLGKGQRRIGLALVESAGARLSRRLGQSASRNALLRLLRAMPLPVLPSPGVLGVDDFTLRKGA